MMFRPTSISCCISECQHKLRLGSLSYRSTLSFEIIYSPGNQLAAIPTVHFLFYFDCFSAWRSCASRKWDFVCVSARRINHTEKRVESPRPEQRYSICSKAENTESPQPGLGAIPFFFLRITIETVFLQNRVSPNFICLVKNTLTIYSFDSGNCEPKPAQRHSLLI